MKIGIKKTIETGCVKARVFTCDFSCNDMTAMEAFGEPSIELGGTFGAPPDEFTLPAESAHIKTDSPFVRCFDILELGLPEAKRRGEVWVDAVVQRIKDALDQLRQLVDDFTADELITYPEMPALVHNALPGRDAADAHPASSITNDSLVAGDTVRDALNALAAGGAETSYVAGETFSAFRCIMGGADGRAYVCDNASASRVAGLSVVAAVEGEDVTVRHEGPVENAVWSWAVDAPVFCGSGGVLTQIPPSTGYICMMGIPISPTKIILGIRQPIQLT